MSKAGRPITKKGGKRITIRLSEEATENLEFLMKKFDCNLSDAIERAITIADEKLKTKKMIIGER